MSINRYQYSKKTKKNKGFTLIEVLITVVILALGLLGLAGLQINSLRDNLRAEHRGKAVQLAYDMADRMRSNIVGLNDYTDAPAENTNCIAVPIVGCTAQQQAGHDRFEWERAIANSLPLGEGDVSEAADVYSITVAWDDDRSGAIDASDAQFTVRFFEP
ncbi:MAG: type IV pilus modification protein PilV [Methylophaga sp.]|nr:MAG: type IV pilus modification protein PilV [Methylophaga sp.]